ncbi:hypothetical protein C7120_04235 [Prevotella sp. oral taxon 376]|nr:hypothetical protein C7120_04235 [Prevotella sp. oral taxon 376]
MALSMNLFKIEHNPRKGLYPFEWVVITYLLLTLAFTFFAYTKLENPESMIVGRVRILAMTAALWIVYRLVPCRFTEFLRVLPQMALLSVWYPDTYEINRIFPNLDHWFAEADQALFGFQPALLFAKALPSPLVSELMDMGYSMYYFIIALVALWYFFRRHDEFQKCVFIIMGSFFLFYVIFDLLPVVGPTFYYKAVGIDQIAKGVFPSLGDYFNHHTDCLPSPGYTNGVFYQLVETAKQTGERPTAAFPSSHVGVATVCMLLILKAESKSLFFIVLPVFIFLCLATVYIQAHYVVDAIAGFFTGAAFFYGLLAVSNKMSTFAPPSKRRKKR